jgi:DMSO/TMAO reductase YedYZ molybdopterin-dependent catalytic subunit
MRTRETVSALPPGQQAVTGFPRFGTHLHLPPPPVPAEPRVEIVGTRQPLTRALSELSDLPRRELRADFHCVSGWTATGLCWSGIPFRAFYEQLVEPALAPETAVTHLVFACLDGYRVVVCLEDALAQDVLLADRLEGRPLDSEHGAPLRLVSPSQYGYVNAKHLCRIEIHDRDPGENFGSVHPLGRLAMRGPLFQRHPRGRVWHEERHRYLPGRLLRPAYRLLRPPIFWLSARRRGR